MLLVLLGVFVLAVVAAQAVTQQRQSSVSFSVRYPAMFQPAAPEGDLPGVFESRTAVIDGQWRRLEIVKDQASPIEDAAYRKYEALRMYRDVTGLNPDRDEVDVVLSVGLLGNHAAAELVGPGRLGKGFVMLRTTIVADRLIGIVYSGEGELTDVDRIYFARQCSGENFQIIGPPKKRETRSR